MDKVLFRSLTFLFYFVLTYVARRLYIVKLKNFLAINQITYAEPTTYFVGFSFYLRVKDEADYYQDD